MLRPGREPPLFVAQESGRQHRLGLSIGINTTLSPYQLHIPHSITSHTTTLTNAVQPHLTTSHIIPSFTLTTPRVSVYFHAMRHHCPIPVTLTGYTYCLTALRTIMIPHAHPLWTRLADHHKSLPN